MPYIKINNVNKTFFPNTIREHYALKNINIDIKKGDFITIVGGNGAGKSTLLNALAGSFKLDSGEILLEDKDISKLPEHKRAIYISRVFQNSLQGTAPRMTVAENMAIASKNTRKRLFNFSINKKNKEKFKDYLKKLGLGLDSKLESEMGLLSGGQRQAISLLMATMNKPKLLLLDEHTSALDPKTQKIIMKLTEEQIIEKNITALMITHNIKDALKYGNRLIILHQGEIVKDFNSENKKLLTRSDIYKILEELEV